MVLFFDHGKRPSVRVAVAECAGSQLIPPLEQRMTIVSGAELLRKRSGVRGGA
jgi:hypothetical protein